MKKRLKDKIKEIEVFLDEFNKIIPNSLNKYKKDIEKKAACERYFEKIVESVIDLAFITIKLKKLDLPEDEKDAFNILLNNNIIDEKLCKRLKDAKGMRNIIIHQYGKIDDGLIFDSISHELEKDVLAFIKQIEKSNK